MSTETEMRCVQVWSRSGEKERPRRPQAATTRSLVWFDKPLVDTTNSDMSTMSGAVTALGFYATRGICQYRRTLFSNPPLPRVPYPRHEI